MELLRITRKSNDAAAFVALCLCFLMMALMAVLVYASWDTGVMPFVCGIIGALMAYGVIMSLAGILSPFQREFVIEMDQLRFGRTDQLTKQRIILRSDVKCFIIDADQDPSICVSTGKTIAPNLAPEIVENAEQILAVARVIQENWPEVPVYNRPQFQTICRQNRRAFRN